MMINGNVKPKIIDMTRDIKVLHIKTLRANEKELEDLFDALCEVMLKLSNNSRTV